MSRTLFTFLFFGLVGLSTEAEARLPHAAESTSAPNRPVAPATPPVAKHKCTDENFPITVEGRLTCITRNTLEIENDKSTCRDEIRSADGKKFLTAIIACHIVYSSEKNAEISRYEKFAGVNDKGEPKFIDSCADASEECSREYSATNDLEYVAGLVVEKTTCGDLGHDIGNRCVAQLLESLGETESYVDGREGNTLKIYLHGRQTVSRKPVLCCERAVKKQLRAE